MTEDNIDVGEPKSPTSDVEVGLRKESVGAFSASDGAGSSEKLTPGPGDKKKTASSEGATKKISIFKKRIWMFQAGLIAFVVIMCITQLVIAISYFKDSKKNAAMISSDILHEVHTLQKALLISLTEPREVFKEFVKGGSQYTRDEMNHILHTDAELAYTAMNALVDLDMKILASAYDTRYGEVLDPNGLVSHIRETYKNGLTDEQSILQAIRVDFITKEEFLKLNAPYYLTTDADGFGNYNSIDHQDRVLMAYGVGAIISDGTLIGFRVFGCILNGKHKMIKDSLAAIGEDAFAAMYNYQENQWKIAALVRTHGFSESRTSMVEFKADQEQIQKVYQNQQVIYETQKIDEGQYSIVYSPFPKGITVRNDNKGVVEDSVSPSVLVLGKCSREVDTSMEITTIAISTFLCATVLVILGNAGLSDIFFMQPIYELVTAVDKKDTGKMSTALEKIRNMKSGFIIVVLGTLSIAGLMGGMLLYNFEAVTKTYDAQSFAWSKLRMLEMYYRGRAGEEYAHAQGLAVKPNFRLLFDSNSNVSMPQRVADVSSQLQKWAIANEVEIAVVVNTSKTVIASATVLPPTSLSFDPAGIISTVLKGGTGVRASILMDNADFLAINPAAFSDSVLLPSVTGKPAAVLLTAVPIFSHESSLSPSGVLFVGTLLSGNPKRITVGAVNYFQEGCSGLFYVQNGEATLIASALRKNSVLTTDVADIATSEVKSIVLAAVENVDYEHTFSEILGEKYEVTAELVYPGSEFDKEGHDHLSRFFDDSIVQVHCSPLTKWNKLVVTIKAISSVTFVLNVLTSAVLSYLTFKPIYEFGQRYEKKWSAKSASGGTRLSLGSIIPRMTGGGRSDRKGSTQASSAAN